DVRHGERFARPGNSQKRLIGSSLTQPLDEPLDRLGLVASGLKRTDKLKRRHEGRTSRERNRIASLLLFTLERGLPTAIRSAIREIRTTRRGRDLAGRARPPRAA